jgi:hypothetical protein
MKPRKRPEPDPVEADSRAEAERIAQLPLDVQKQIVSIIRSPAGDPRVRKADRHLARRRADLVVKFLRQLNRKKRSS